MMKQTDNSQIPQVSVAVIDNYDSFTYNLVHLVRSLGARVTVFRNDQFDLPDLADYDKLLLSPGPGIPSEAGLLLNVIRTYAATKPILGVCLGHQAIGEVFGARLTNLAEVFGARLTNLAEVFHGVATEGTNLQRDYIFRDLPPRITMGRYHSWVVERSSLPACLEVTAESDEGFVMALRHRDYDVHGIQFHPESVLTPQGTTIVSNWLKG